MERLEQSRSVAAPVAALALAGGAAAAFAVSTTIGFLSDAAESLFVIAWLAGWILLVTSSIVAAVYAVHLVRKSLSQQPASALEAGLTVASFAVIAVLVAVYPLWESGSAFA